MAVGSGLAAQLMIGEEVTYGVPVAPTRATDLVNENLKLKVERILANGLRAGRLLRTSQQWMPGKRSAAGDINVEVANVGFGLWLKHMFGSIVTTGSAGVFQHTAKPADLGGKSLVVQIGRPAIGGTVQPFTYTGAKFAAWELSLKAGEIAKLKVSVIAQNEMTGRSVADGVSTSGSPTYTSATAGFAASDVGFAISGTNIPASTTIVSVTNATTVTMSANATASGTTLAATIGVALAAATYPATSVPLTFVSGYLTVAGTQVDVDSVMLKGLNGLQAARFMVRNAPTPKEPLQDNWRDYTGQFVADFTDLTLYNRYTGGAEASLVLNLLGGVISGANSFSLTITCNVRFDGDTTAVAGPQMLDQPVSFACVASGATDDTAITAVYQTSDAAP
ncbi:MAG TPA: phage tail tube protein [Candidatus Dormibacteraeota bacterium]|jgi:hypothetical protein|nr:phage tail tube protein [Candidatus Dormibacteraeota bacterium]